VTLKFAASALVLLAIAAAGCGSASRSSSAPAVIDSGQIQPSAAVVGGARVAVNGGRSTATTIPLAKEDPTTGLFSALGEFQSCLKGLGVTFSGAPSAGNPNSPANNPSYLKSLTTCAAQSHIVQALAAEKTAQQDLTPAQVASENKVYLKWRSCMIARGWQIPKPKPDAKGALFAFGTSGGSGAAMKPPPGQSGFSSPDIQACVAKAQKGSSS
jgi:hypothetical protein